VRDSANPLVLYDLGVGEWVSGQFDRTEPALRRADAIDPCVADSVAMTLPDTPAARDA